jgi:tetratricopeptide (TPR) repeat protein
MTENRQKINDIGEKEDRIFRKQYGSVLRSAGNSRAGSCPPSETLIQYNNKELTGGMNLRTEDHVIVCPACWKAVEALQAVPAETEGDGIPDNWTVVEKSLNNKFYEQLKKYIPPVQGKKSIRRSGWIQWVQAWVNTWKIRPVLAYSSRICVLTVSVLYLLAWLGRDDAFSLARIRPEKQAILRSPSVESGFKEGLDWLQQKNYKKAAIRLTEWSLIHPYHYESRYYLGLALLCDAEKSLPGLAYTFDDSKVERGMNQLHEALSLAGDNVYYQTDCRWYLGKAWLMKQEPGKARAEFEKIIGLNPPYDERVEETRIMIAAIDHLETARR